ncbi:PREDICTED: uncharacterized protein LOC103090730 [Lipotes vexillifer]|uniref:Uncharacterized protein LOC103090730 n=1 Tax=Lipotes vexillifer TaxID=118797 RepID=A0A340WP49_LIPVE|nr:PREDICTED: uncharacterized protein LOC103090730 [Lipotes vexillifer]
MLWNWSKYQSSEKMQWRVYKGIPPHVQGQVWSLPLDVEKVKAETKGNTTYSLSTCSGAALTGQVIRSLGGGLHLGDPLPIPSAFLAPPRLTAHRPAWQEGPAQPPCCPSRLAQCRHWIQRWIDATWNQNKPSRTAERGEGQSHTARDRNQGGKSKETPTETMKGEGKAKPESGQETGLFPLPQRGPCTRPVRTAQPRLSTEGTPRSHSPGRLLCVPRQCRSSRGNAAGVGVTVVVTLLQAARKHASLVTRPGFRNKQNELSTETAHVPRSAQRPLSRGTCGCRYGFGLTLAPPTGNERLYAPAASPVPCAGGLLHVDTVSVPKLRPCPFQGVFTLVSTQAHRVTEMMQGAPQSQTETERLGCRPLLFRTETAPYSWVARAPRLAGLPGGGHCQSMKQVVAVLLMFLSKEDTFWALVQLMTDEKHATHGRCLMWTAGCASGPGVSPQSSPGSRAGGDPSPVHLSISEGPWLPTLPSGPSVPATSRQLSLPCWSFCLMPATPQCPPNPWPDKAPQHPLLCPQPGCQAQETARHTPVPHPVGRTPCPLLPGPPSHTVAALGRASARTKCPPGPQPRAPAELGLQEWGLCPGLTSCPAREGHDEEQVSTGIYTTKWFLQCFIDREFLQDTLSQVWALEDDTVLRQLQASMAELCRMKCDLLPRQMGSAAVSSRVTLWGSEQ